MPSRFIPDLKGLAALIKGTAIQNGCVLIAQPEAARIRAGTTRRSGETADSTRVERVDFGTSKGAMIVQEGAAVALNWGNVHTRAIHQATGGRG